MLCLLVRHNLCMTPPERSKSALKLQLSLQKEQRATFTVAHKDYEQGLNKHSFFKVHNRILSEDLVQDTFIKTWAYIVKGGQIAVMKAFLYHILNDLIIDEYRKKKPVSLDVLLEKGFEPSNTDEDQLVNTLDGRAALLLLKSLPLKYQNIMRMRYAENLSLKEMSVITGQTTNTLAVQIHRGLEKLKILYNPL